MHNDNQKLQRQRRVRKKLLRSSTKVRLSVFRSNQYVYAQLIDDTKGKTLATVSEKVLNKDLPAGRQGAKTSRMERARTVGVELAKKALAQKVSQVVFDKGSYAYHGRVKAIAEGAREGGLSF
jgi:large subunit ribosomal protein L18